MTNTNTPTSYIIVHSLGTTERGFDSLEEALDAIRGIYKSCVVEEYDENSGPVALVWVDQDAQDRDIDGSHVCCRVFPRF